MNYLELISAFVGGGLVQSGLNYVLSSRTARKDELSQVIATWQADNERLRKENQVLHEEMRGLRDEVADLRAKVILMESAHTDAPLPMWLKDTMGRMLSLNSEYERCFLAPFGKTADDYIGQYDEDVWDEATAGQFRKNDSLALLNGVWKGTEQVPLPDGTMEDWLILKYTRMAGRVKIGIAGIAIPTRWD